MAETSLLHGLRTICSREDDVSKKAKVIKLPTGSRPLGMTKPIPKDERKDCMVIYVDFVNRKKIGHVA